MAAPKTGSPVVIIFCGPDMRRYLVGPYLVTGKCGGDFDGLVGRIRPRSARTTVTQDLCAALRKIMSYKWYACSGGCRRGWTSDQSIKGA